jgi:catechol 2,3-dioxygenase-like lactoylglutathione lyase family enzyme
MIRNLAHLCFVVRDLDASLAFYVEKLGLRHAFDATNDAGERTGVYIAVGGRTFIELFKGGDVHAAASGVSYQHFCMEVDDLASMVARLRAHAIGVTDPKVGRDRSLQAWLQDPDGNRIELHQYTPQSKQAPSLV